MPSAAPKRRRQDEDSSKSRTKHKNFKRQKAYYSSSEDDAEESDDESNPRTSSKFVASDAPRPQQIVGPASSLDANNKVQKKPATQNQKPVRSILKHAQASANDADMVINLEGGGDNALEDATMLNIVMGNMAKLTSATAGKQQIEDLSDHGAAASTLVEDTGKDNDEDEDEDEQDIELAEVDDLSEDDDDDLDLNDEPDLDSDNSSTTPSTQARNAKKRNDPSAFANSISKILSTKLSNSKRADPVLSRSATAAEAQRAIADEKLANHARTQIRAEKHEAMNRGRVRDVLGLSTADVDTGALLEQEKRLKKTAQRGVVKLFNAVRAAQVKAEEAMAEARRDGVVGMQKRDERVNEMSKQGFLDLISSGGKAGAVKADA